MIDLTTMAMATALVATPIYSTESRSPSWEADSAEISVLTYNVRGLPWPIAHGRAQALRRIGEELAAMRAEGRQPDVVLIQEGFRGEVEALVAASGYRYWAQGPRRNETPPSAGFAPAAARRPALGEGWGKFTGGGLHVLSDAPITEVMNAAYHACAGLDCLANKGAMLVRVAFPKLPFDVEVVNTHLNSRRAARAPREHTLRAHNAQTEQLYAFIKDHRRADAPLLIGGDFNVRNAPDRYYHQADLRPFAVVSEFCSRTGSGCEGHAAGDVKTPWLQSQDLQAFGEDGVVKIQPLQAQAVFTAQDGGGRLSDHDGYLVRYRLSWEAPDAPREAETPVKVQPQFGKWGVKVSWKY